MRVRFRALTTTKSRAKATDSLKKDIKDYLTKFGQETIAELRQYPPVPETSNYHRTYALQRSWKAPLYETAGGLTLSIKNDVENDAANIRHRRYQTFVVGEDQTAYHAANGWPYVPDEIDKRRKQFRSGLMKLYNKHLGD